MTDEVEDFKIAVRDYINLSNELSDIQKSIKDKRSRLKNLQEFILGFMKTHNKDCCDLGDNGVLVVKQRKTKVAFKKDDLEQMLKHVISDTDAAKSIEYIYENQKTKVSEYLHRSNDTI